MFVSAEIIAIVLSAVGLLLTLGGTMVAGFAWCVRRSDRVEERLGARIDGVEERLGARIDAVAADTTELKIAMARIEGPQRHLIVAAR
ncbi:hypothetical protein ACIP5T_13610 [Microbacterium sp. NPDC088619]|uniref:hypothetical protein n=1 Tax=Microbacterium sp. NPDC088619 TaxID=3364196 RepID=UPI0037FD9FB2